MLKWISDPRQPCFLGRRRVHRSGLSRLRNITCCVAATWGVLTSGIAAAANDQPADRQPPAAAVVAAYTSVRLWVDRFETPRLDDAASKVKMENCAAVCVILRRSGRVVGIGMDSGGDDLMARRAAGKAINQVLSDPALQHITAELHEGARKDPGQALTIEAVHADLGKSITIEVEVAGKLTPLVGQSLAAISRKIEPGVDGVALRRQDDWTVLFPAQLRTTNTGGDPDKMLLNLALSANIAPQDLDSLSKRQDLSLYSFETMDLAQPGVGASPVPLTRGDVIVRQSEVSAASIAKLADGLAKHLLASMIPDMTDSIAGAAGPSPRQPLGIAGSYSVIADQYEPLIAPPLEQALAAFALARYSTCVSVDPAAAASAAHAATSILRDLATVAPGEDDPHVDPLACAAIIYAVAALPASRTDAGMQELFNSAVKAVQGTFDPATGFSVRAKSESPARAIPAHGQALLAGAMARLITMGDNPSPAISAAIVRKAIDAAWQSTPEPQRIALLPWIGWAETDLARATRSPTGHAEDLRAMRDLIGEIQLGSESRPAPAELRGGLALTGETGRDRQARPTAQTVRPIAWLGSVLADNEITPANKAGQTRETQLRAMRFLMQLTIRQPLGGLTRNPAKAVGGLRGALWDSDQPLPAQALGLLAAVETLEHLESK